MDKRILVILTVLLTIFSQGFAVNTSDNAFSFVKVVDYEDRFVLKPSGTIDDPQPDTLKYDDGNPMYVLTSMADYFTGVKFTAPVDFLARSVYISINNQNNNQSQSLTVKICADSNGVPGTVLDSMVVPAPVGQGWLDINLNTPLQFDYGENFHVYYNSPGGNFPSGRGWWSYFDGYSYINRTLISSDGIIWNGGVGDCMIRVGGEFEGTPQPMIELSSNEIVFAPVMAGETDRDTITISNPGIFLNLTITGIEIEATTPPNIFSIVNGNPPFTVEPMNNYDIILEFAPRDTGIFTSLMRIENDSPDSVVAVHLTGWCVPDPVSISLEPFNPPILIPVNGGSFEFNITLINNWRIPVDFDIWTMITLPLGGIYGPIQMLNDCTLPASAVVSRDKEQFVPAYAPSGSYTYKAYAGNYPDEIWAEDNFYFGKYVTSDGSGIVDNWDCYGDEFGGEEAAITSPTSKFVSLSAYPNPFNAQTVISFQLQAASNVSLDIFDVTGRVIRVQQAAPLHNQYMPAGSHSVVFDAEGMTSGVYFVRLEAGDFRGTQKILFIK